MYAPTGKVLATGTAVGVITLYDVEKCEVVGQGPIAPPPPTASSSGALAKAAVAAPGKTQRPITHLSWVETASAGSSQVLQSGGGSGGPGVGGGYNQALLSDRVRGNVHGGGIMPCSKVLLPSVSIYSFVISCIALSGTDYFGRRQMRMSGVALSALRNVACWLCACCGNRQWRTATCGCFRLQWVVVVWRRQLPG